MSKITPTIVAILLFSELVVAQKPSPQLPQRYIDTTWNAPTGGTTWAAHTAAQFSSALTSSSSGDVIVLDAGVTYVGNFTLPAKTNPQNKWIYIETSNYSALPPPGTRVTPSDAVKMPKLVSPNATAVMKWRDGSNHVRFVGIEMYSASTYRPSGYTPGIYYAYGLTSAYSNPPGKQGPLPDSITFDRCYVHGDNTHDVQSGINGDVSNMAVVDSWVSDIHMKGTDTQAFQLNWTPGPIKLVNNHLEAAGEDVIFGGGGGPNVPYVPSDIEIRNNHLYKPLSWVALTTGSSPQWTEKNGLEFKTARRVLVDSNVIENTWTSGQEGYGVLLTVRTSQSGNIAVVDDVTITNNVLKNVQAGFMTMTFDAMCGAKYGYPNCTNVGESKRIKIQNNLVMLRDQTALAGTKYTKGILIDDGFSDLVFQHNTIVSYNNQTCYWGIYFAYYNSSVWPPTSSRTHNIWILDNSTCKPPSGYGLNNATTLAYYMSDPSPMGPRFYGNAMYVPPGNSLTSWPVHNYATTVAFTYVNPSTANYQLVTPYWTDTSDGQLSGVNAALLPNYGQ
jgi:hypothetical protein